jgi:hypothetical protein
VIFLFAHTIKRYWRELKYSSAHSESRH